MLNNLITILDREIINGVPATTMIVMTEKSNAEAYADWWLEEENMRSEPGGVINSLLSKLEEQLNENK